MNTQNTKEEILNIDWHIEKLMLKALNSSPNIHITIQKLGITEKQFYILKKGFNIKLCKETKLYKSNYKKQIVQVNVLQ